MGSGILRRAAELVVAAVIGAGVTLGGVAVFAGLDGHTTTVREIVSGGPVSAPAAFRTGRPQSINEIYRLVEELLRTGLEPIYKPDLSGEAQVTLADIEAARELGWEPRVDLHEGLRRSTQYIRERVLQAVEDGDG